MNFDIRLVETAEKEALRIKEEGEKIYGEMLQACKFLQRVESTSPYARELLKESESKARHFVNECLNHPLSIIRHLSWLAYLDCYLASITTREEMSSFISSLVQQKILLETDVPRGLKWLGKNYKINTDFLLLNNEELGRVNHLFKEVLKKIDQSCFITFEELLAGTPGEALIEIPTEKVQYNGKEIWRGGEMRVYSDGVWIYPIEGRGSVKNALNEAQTLGVKLSLKCLAKNHPPYIKGEIGKKIRLMWYLLKKSEVVYKKKTDLICKSDLLLEEFFFEKKEGTCFIDIKDGWRWKISENRIIKIKPFFLLIERIGGEMTTMTIRIKELPQHLYDFFSNCTSEEGYQEHNNFMGLPQPMRAVLQHVHSQLLKGFKDRL